MKSQYFERDCPVCKSNDPDYWYRPAQSPGPVVQCKVCGFVYVNPIEKTKAIIHSGPELGDYHPDLLESSDLEEINGSWEQPLIEEHLLELPAKEKNAENVLKLVNSIASHKGTLLDIGCFCGVFLNTASQAGWDCYGIEPLVMPAIYARGHYGLRVVTDILREDTFSPNFFDAITAFQVFEHMVHPDEELRKIRRILKPGGLVVIEVPSIETFMVKFLRSKHRHFVQDHVSFFSPETLSVLMERTGFQIKKVYYPARTMSLRHFVRWMIKLSRLSNSVAHTLPQRIQNKAFRLNLRDIVTVIAKKE